ncbi:MAG: glycosyltransferase [Candidatus Gastranaerophilaceae bacterium]|jgi:glycosyltransferase involved in cell wall biosynthesis
MLKRDLNFNPYLPDNRNFFDESRVDIKIKKVKNVVKPKFSIVIPCFNERERLIHVLNSFANQVYPKTKYELIVIDDGSTDMTYKLLKKLSFDCDFKYIYWERPAIEMKKKYKDWASFYNRAGPARNVAVKHARGEILLFNDADIIVERDCLKKHETYHDKFENTIVRGYRMCLPENIDYKLIKNFEYLKKIARHEKPKSERKMHCRLYNLKQEGWQRVVTCNLSIRKKYFEKINGFSQDFVFWGFEDLDLGYRLRELGSKFVWDDKIVVYHLYHPKESGGGRKNFLAFKVGVNILFNKYKDPEIVNIFTDIIKKRFKKYL